MHRLCITIAAFSLSLSATGQSNPSALDLTDPDAKALIGVDLRSLLQSPLAQMFGDDIKSAKFPGKELLEDVDQVLVSSPGALPGGKKENPPFLIIATGHFAPEHIGPLLQMGHQTYHEVEIYTMGDNMGAAQLDGQTLVLGDVPSVKAAVDRRGAKSPNSLVSRGAAMGSKYDVWAIATISPAAFQPGQLNAVKFVQDVRGINLGMSFRDGLDVDLGLVASTPKAADDMGKMVSFGLQAALTSKLDAQQAQDVARKMQISLDGNQMHVKFGLSKEELEKQIRTIQKAPAIANPVNRPAQTIKIYGLDDGVREIPVAPRF